MPASILLFFNLGFMEIFVIFMVVLLFFGSDKIPVFARGLAKGIRQFRDASQEIQDNIQNTIDPADFMDPRSGTTRKRPTERHVPPSPPAEPPPPAAETDES
ncbi:MAG: twin-arginine translocase TatA/TatE family subunit [Bacteroidota bacterium]